MKTQSFTLHTDRQGCYDITAAVCKCISDADIQSGACIVFCPHTTAAIAIGRNAGLQTDAPDVRYMNTSTSEVIPVEAGKALLGAWQGVYFVESGGPNVRTYFVKVMADR